MIAHELIGEMLATPQLSQQLAGGVFAFLGDTPSASLKLSPDTAVIPVIGALTHRVAGTRSYQDIGNEIRAAANNPSIKRIVLEIDSQGGSVSGCFELADKIHAIAQDSSKPDLIAYVNGMCASAAYLIASQCNQVLSSKYSQIGSIGVVTSHTDLSGAMEKAGVVKTFIYAGNYKVDGSSAAPLSAEVKERTQSKINATYENFLSTVARSGRTTAKQLRETKADIFTAPKANEQNLIDNIVSAEKLGDYLSSPQTSPRLSEGASGRKSAMTMAKPHSGVNLEAKKPLQPFDTTGKQNIAATLNRLGLDTDLITYVNTTK